MRLALALLLALPAAASACQRPDPATLPYPEMRVVEAPAGSAVTAAYFGGPTTRYGHAVLGDGVEFDTLTIEATGIAPRCGVTLAAGADHVFEDVIPRLVDLDNDGTVEVIVVRTSWTEGAQLAVYGLRDGDLGLIAATPYIGRSRRWLAPVGAADLDGDGRVEVAYIDRPHLAKTLRIWRFENDSLTEVAAAAGLTNHRIGEPFISGGIRDCGGPPEMITANADWSAVIATRFDGAQITGREVAPFTGPSSMEAALAC